MGRPYAMSLARDEVAHNGHRTRPKMPDRPWSEPDLPGLHDEPRHGKPAADFE
jgi:hypothetical protein